MAELVKGEENAVDKRRHWGVVNQTSRRTAGVVRLWVGGRCRGCGPGGVFERAFELVDGGGDGVFENGGGGVGEERPKERSGVQTDSSETRAAVLAVLVNGGERTAFVNVRQRRSHEFQIL